MKKGFTLAEIMVVLTVIGILTAILLPVAFQAAPDEDVMKFKKANSTLGTAIRELVNSDKYYLDGDLGIKADGTQLIVSSSYYTYFCESLADILAVKSKNCSTYTGTAYGLVSTVAGATSTTDNTSTAKANLDTYCKNVAKSVGAEIITSDGVVWYQGAPTYTFGRWQDITNQIRLFGGSGTAYYQDENGFDAAYKVFCIDIDGIDSSATAENCVNECPFGYGIRADGKILLGNRAEEWVEKSIQRGSD